MCLPVVVRLAFVKSKKRIIFRSLSLTGSSHLTSPSSGGISPRGRPILQTLQLGLPVPELATHTPNLITALSRKSRIILHAERRIRENLIGLADLNKLLGEEELVTIGRAHIRMPTLSLTLVCCLYLFQPCGLPHWQQIIHGGRVHNQIVWSHFHWKCQARFLKGVWFRKRRGGERNW